MSLERSIVLSGLMLMAAGCSRTPATADVRLQSLQRHGEISVGPVRAGRGAVDISRPFARALAETGVFAQVELVPTVIGQELGVVGSIDGSCDSEMGDQGATIAIGATLVATLAVAMAVDQGDRCELRVSYDVVRNGRPWRSYHEEIVTVVPTRSDFGSVLRAPARRLAAQIARDLEAGR